MVQNDGIFNFCTCISIGSGTIACNFKDTNIRLMYVSCVAYVFDGEDMKDNGCVWLCISMMFIVKQISFSSTYYCINLPNIAETVYCQWHLLSISMCTFKTNGYETTPKSPVTSPYKSFKNHEIPWKSEKSLHGYLYDKGWKVQVSCEFSFLSRVM